MDLTSNNLYFYELSLTMIKTHIHVVCAVVLCCFIVLIVNIYEYTLDEDISQIEFKEFNSDESHIYPSVTLCLTNPLLAEKY